MNRTREVWLRTYQCLGTAKIYVQLLKHRAVKNVATNIEKTEAINYTPPDFLQLSCFFTCLFQAGFLFSSTQNADTGRLSIKQNGLP